MTPTLQKSLMTVVEQLGRQTESNILQWILSYLVTGAFVCFLCSIVIVIKLCLRKRRKDIFCSGQIRNRSEGGAPGCVCSIILSFAFSAKLAPTDPSTYNKHSKKYGYIIHMGCRGQYLVIMMLLNEG